jgi:Bifunctional DNA primase/polymerase, N-terminal
VSGREQDIQRAVVLDYAARGYAVFPCLPESKVPAFPGGFKNGTTNPATIRRWWLARPDYNIGIATGVRSGVWVLDVDGAYGAVALIVLEATYGPLPVTLASVTSNGCHLWFRYTCPIQCSADDRIGRGLDVRGDGGYVIAPPSVHPDGPIYCWTNDRTPAVAPEWLVKLTRKPPPKPITSKIIFPTRPLGRSGAYGKAALDQEIATLANTPQGGRNHALNRASFRLHQLVAGGELDSNEVHKRLLDAAIANGLMTDPQDGARSVQATIASGARAGLQYPRSSRGR